MTKEQAVEQAQNDPEVEEISKRVAEQTAEAIQVANDPQEVPVNMYETDNALVVVAPLPGVMAPDVEVLVDESRLVISASMRTPAPKSYLRHEWHYGPYERTLTLPDGFGGPVTASFGNGQLAVSVARGEGRSGRTVVQPTP